MMFGEVIGVKAGPVIGLGDFQPVFVKFRQRPAGAVKMVEDAEFHFFLAFVLIHFSRVGAKRNAAAIQA
jgi:hypothetical protein